MYEQPVVPVVPRGCRPRSWSGDRSPQAEQQLVSANARIGVAKAEFFSKLNLDRAVRDREPRGVGSHGRQRDDMGCRRHAQRSALQRGPHARDLPGVIAQWEQAKLQYEQARHSLREVSDALTPWAS